MRVSGTATRLTKICLGILLFLAVDTHAAILMPGDIVVADRGSSGSGKLVLINPLTGTQTVIASGGSLVNPVDVVIESGSSLLVADANAFGGSGGILRVDTVTGIQSVVSFGGYFVDPAGLFLDASGTVFVADQSAFGGPGGIIRVDVNSGTQTVVSSGGWFRDPLNVILDSTGNILVADPDGVDPQHGAILRVDPVTGAQTILSNASELVNPFDLGISAGGDLIVTDIQYSSNTDGKIFRIDQSSGTVAAVATGGSPLRFDFDANDNLILINNFYFGGAIRQPTILRVDHATGVQQVISTGGLMDVPVGIAVMANPVPEPASLFVWGLMSAVSVVGGSSLRAKRRRNLVTK